MKRLRYLYKYIIHFFLARNTRGFGVHSPFVFKFTNNVLVSKGFYYVFREIESIRFDLKHNKRRIDITDFGSGSYKTRKVSDIAKHSLKSPKYGQLLYRIANYFNSRSVLEFGTSLGVTTSYLAASSTEIHCTSLEGCPQTARIAQENFKKLGLKNIDVVLGNIDDTLSHALSNITSLDLVFFDANHRSEYVLSYFDQCLSKVNNNTVMVFDDIYWSSNMEMAWNEIKENPLVTSSIDLFEVGIIFFNPDLHKKHYKMRY